MTILFMNSLSNIAGLSLGIMIFNSLNFMVNTPPSFASLPQQLNRQSSVLKLAQLPQQTMDKQIGGLYVQSETKSQVFP